MTDRDKLAQVIDTLAQIIKRTGSLENLPDLDEIRTNLDSLLNDGDVRPPADAEPPARRPMLGAEVAPKPNAPETVQDILARLGAKIARAEKARDTSKPDGRASLAPDRHPNRDFFVADIINYALKDDRHSMEHPFFSLSKNPDHRIRHYERNGVRVTVAPGAHGMATIWDKDILIYAISQLVEAMNQGRPVNSTIRLKAHDLMVVTNRHTGGEHFKRLAESFERLAGTRIQTNIVTNGQRIIKGFGLLDNWTIVEKTPNGRMVTIELTLNRWLFNAIIGREILTLNRDYFRLDGGLERRLYELARKHCGKQALWWIGLPALHEKTGTTGSIRDLRRMVKRIAAADRLPDYRLQYEHASDTLLVYTRDPEKLVQGLIEPPKS